MIIPVESFLCFFIKTTKFAFSTTVITYIVIAFLSSIIFFGLQFESIRNIFPTSAVDEAEGIYQRVDDLWQKTLP